MRFAIRSESIASFALCACVAFAGCDSKASRAVATASPESTAGTSSNTGFVVVDVPPSQGDILTAIRAEIAKAKAKGLKPFVEFSASWCAPCEALKKSLGDSRMQAAFKGTYLIRLDFDEWAKRIGDSGFAPQAIPVIYEVSDDGKPTGRKIGGDAWADNIPENMAPPLDKFFHAGREQNL